MQNIFPFFLFDLLSIVDSDLFNKESKMVTVLVSEFSFTIVNAALKSFNNESLLEYSHRIFRIAEGKSNSDESKILLKTSNLNTMQIFILNLKKEVKFADKKHEQFAIFSFSLLLNSSNLSNAKRIFSHLVLAFG